MKASDYSLDISKLILAGVVLAGVVDLNVNKAFLLVSGIAVVFIFALVGFFLYILGNQSKL
ncbi:MAG: ABC transporter permease [Prevotella sp.]|nr:ABC transporter permease [Prevotella sp.]